MALLKVVNGRNPGQEIPLEGSRSVLGRHPSCDIKLEDGSVSREHAQILHVNGRWFIEDLRSRNGTFVNGQLVHERRQLEENDQLKICDLQFSFHHSLTSMSATATFDMKPPSTELALLVDDAADTSTSTIMSKLDVASSQSGLRMVVKPEMKLRALFEITENLGKALAQDEVLLRILDSLFKIFVQADRGYVVLRTSEDGPLVPKAVKLRRGDGETIRISRTIVRQVMESGEAILSADATSDSRFEMSQSIADFRIRSMMCAPLIASDKTPLGVIQIDTVDQRNRFQQDDLDVLASVARQAAVAVENAQLHERALSQQRIEHDLALAHRVQQGFLPSSRPTIPDYEFFDFYEPANHLGGDYFDYIALPGGRLAVVLADVSGKGIPAALLMARLSSETRFSLVSEPEPAKAMDRLNEAFQRAGWEDRFVTLVLAVIDIQKHTLTTVNAGHMPPFLRHASGEVEEIGADEAGVPLGVDADTSYHQCQIELNHGDRVVVFTDGISEAMNDAGKLYGLKRLRTQVARSAVGIADMGRNILDDVNHFVGVYPQTDDMCLTCFGRV